MISVIVRRCALLTLIFSGSVIIAESMDDIFKNASKEEISLQITQEYDRMLSENNKEVREHLFKLYVLCVLGGFCNGISRADIKEAWKNRDVGFFVRRIPAGLLGVGEVIAVISKFWDNHVLRKSRDETIRAIDREFAMRELMMKSGIVNKAPQGLSAGAEQEDELQDFGSSPVAPAA